MLITRSWAMPSHQTFSIKPIEKLINKYNNNNYCSIDPFANYSRIAKINNDLDPSYGTEFNLDAIEFLNLFPNESVDLVLFDPPYSVRQLSEVYKKLKRSVTMETTQSSFWSNLKDGITRVVKKDGIVISFAWNSNGIGKTRGFEIIEILLVSHGGAHNDTICVVEKKIR